MKAVILAGGIGTRISEESAVRPKPMIEIGGKPILWHIMKIYAANGITDFVICLGYKGYLIKEYFANYFLHLSDVTIDLTTNEVKIHQNSSEPWKVSLIDTGEDTMTGGRIKRISSYLDDNEPFCLTYGDGVANIDIRGLISFHKKQGSLATLTAVQPPGRFGALDLQENRIRGFQEKPHGDGGWVNGGFFVCSKKVISYIENDQTIWERQPMQQLAQENELSGWMHHGFWQPMDTLRDKNLLEELWQKNEAPWKVW
jgi:glucose-1-phosphate cytidylyltransferase